MLRFLDIVLSFVGLVVSFPVLVLLTILGFFDTGAPIFCQTRVGRFKAPFVLIKFRTMKRETASVASHLASIGAITSYGRFLRKTKLDELPQLWNVLRGDMSLVGPRPCLFNQEELIAERERRGVLNSRPGITGLAQIKNIEMSTPELLAKTDKIMLSDMSVKKYFTYIFLTALGAGGGDAIR
jgi:O-antigen biosynthesis protein WbqP